MLRLVLAIATMLPLLTATLYAADEVKLGMLIPLTGPVAPTGAELRRGAEFAADEINRNGGIESLGGARMRLVFADTRGLPEVGVTESERLVLQEKVSAMLGAFQSGVTITTTQVAERYHIPYIVLVSVAPGITQRGFKYVFRPTETAEVDTRVQMDYLKWIAERSGIRPKTAALVGENSEWGETSIELTRSLLPRDMRVVLDERYSPGTADFITLAQKLRQTAPDLIFFASYVSDGILITRALAQQNVRAMAILTRGAEHGDPSFAKAVGDFGDYQTWMVPFHPAQARRQPWMEPTLAEYRRRLGSEMTPFAATAYADVHIIRDAIERAGSTDPERVRAALATTHLTRGPAMLLPYSVIEFDATGQNPQTTLPLIQTVAGTDHIVFPPELADLDFRPVYPMPGWSEIAQARRPSMWIQTLANGALNGGMYALFALGLSLIFGVMRVINFAHGSLLMVGMFATYWASRILEIGPYWTLLLVVPFLFLVGYLLQSALLNRLLRRDPDAIEPVSALLLTLGIALVLDNGALLLFGADYRTLATKSHTITIAGYGLDPRRIAIVIVAVGLTACLHLGIKYSRLGLALRAVAQDREAASLQGVDVFRMYAVAFGAGAAIVAVCAGLLAPLYYIHPSVGLVFLITGFLVVVLGGLGSIKGTAAAAWVVGFMEAAIARVFSASAAQAAVFLLFIGFLLLRPEGLSRRGSRIA